MDKILIVDDEQALCALLAKSVGTENVAADCCCTGSEALELVAKNKYQLVVLDVMLPGMDGFEVLARIREDSTVPILMLTAKNDSASKVRGLRAGADDYLTKPFEMAEFIARVLSLIRRYTRLNDVNAGKKLVYTGLTIDVDRREVMRDGQLVELMPREFDALLYFAKNQGRVLTKQQIYEEVWQDTYLYDDSNVMVLICRLRKKIEPEDGSLPYIQTVKGLGYRFNREV